MGNTALRTKYAADTHGMICLLLDIRGQARPNSLQVWSNGKGCIVSLPRFYANGSRAGQPIIRIETENAKRWAAVSVPRWLMHREALYGDPDLQPVMTEFCRAHCTGMRTPQMARDDAERSLAEYVVAQENKYRRLPGEFWTSVKGERRNAAIFA